MEHAAIMVKGKNIVHPATLTTVTRQAVKDHLTFTHVHDKRAHSHE